ncbi:hypothetical protein CONPUDRAFT_74873 [Coniophora puteana RWD-64-598 SS2]|uniref:Uncharacterized protein n=1 Tax=Coniophora puteana (strain RWD-64-598) TaxID=741705 RepID=A0A5M3MH50_CONPW|nr:uncharacterized protein CONPUDRAFT_74873 [Coniophora puteana RWD-64-598 SS2]EIW78104.1 hypothetical protein CONPUDRAFT_74873 [Coniophora puteana RWD-64-598 SS2]
MSFFSKIVKTSTDAIRFFHSLALGTPVSTPINDDILQPGGTSDKAAPAHRLQRKRRASFHDGDQTPKQMKLKQELKHTSKSPSKSPSQRPKLNRTSPPKQQNNEFLLSDGVLRLVCTQLPAQTHSSGKETLNGAVDFDGGVKYVTEAQFGNTTSHFGRREISLHIVRLTLQLMILPGMTPIGQQVEFIVPKCISLMPLRELIDEMFPRGISSKGTGNPQWAQQNEELVHLCYREYKSMEPK